jgi:hypothetical protein
MKYTFEYDGYEVSYDSEIGDIHCEHVIGYSNIYRQHVAICRIHGVDYATVGYHGSSNVVMKSFGIHRAKIVCMVLNEIYRLDSMRDLPYEPSSFVQTMDGVYNFIPLDKVSDEDKVKLSMIGISIGKVS